MSFHIADVQKTVATYAEVDEGSLDAGLQIDNATLVNITGKVVLASALGIKFFERAILQNRDAAFLGLGHIDRSIKP